MKSLKTYNMDQDCIRILKNQPNKSQFVCRAVRRLANNIDTNPLRIYETRRLLAALHSRDDVSPQLKAIILAELTTQV